MNEPKKKEFTPDKGGRRYGRGAKRVDFARDLENYDIQMIIQSKLMESRAHHPEIPATPILNEILHEIKFRLEKLDCFEEKYGDARKVFPEHFKKKEGLR